MKKISKKVKHKLLKFFSWPSKIIYRPGKWYSLKRVPYLYKNEDTTVLISKDCKWVWLSIWATTRWVDDNYKTIEGPTHWSPIPDFPSRGK